MTQEGQELTLIIGACLEMDSPGRSTTLEAKCRLDLGTPQHMQTWSVTTRVEEDGEETDRGSLYESEPSDGNGEINMHDDTCPSEWPTTQDEEVNSSVEDCGSSSQQEMRESPHNHRVGHAPPVYWPYSSEEPMEVDPVPERMICSPESMEVEWSEALMGNSLNAQGNGGHAC